MSIAGIFALGGGCYDHDKHHYKHGNHHYKKDHHYSYGGNHCGGYHRGCKCCDDDDDGGLLGGLLG